MNAKIVCCGIAVAAFLLGNAGTVRAQEDAQEGSQESAPTEAAELFANQALTGASVNAVDVWVLRCTTTPLGFAQVARARVRDNGGVDGRRLYVHITRQFNGRTAKTVAGDGAVVFPAFATVLTGGAGSAHFIVVSKDRTGVAGVPEPYLLQADCIAGGVVRPHTLGLIQNQ